MFSALLIVVIVIGVLATLWAVMIYMPGRSYRGPAPPWSEEERATAQRLEQDVRRLAAEIGERNVWHPEGLEAAAQHIENSFKHQGYELASARFDSFNQQVRNIEASVRGSSRAQDIVLIGAHYDSVMGTVGANDNGSGVAALLEIARRLAGSKPARTLRFVAFVNEEPPHFNIGEMGSQKYAQAAAERGDRIVAMLSLETLAYYSNEPGSQQYPYPFNLLYPDTGNFLGFVGNLGSRRLARRCVEIFRRTTAFPSEGVAAPAWIPGVAWSDHGSFWPHGYPAVMVTDTALYRYPHYHTPEDVPDQLQYDALARVVLGLTQVVQALADEGV